MRFSKPTVVLVIAVKERTYANWRERKRDENVQKPKCEYTKRVLVFLLTKVQLQL